jgi:diadenosine tetraphosphate (Ap4A) HIT family hydrolase
VEQALRDVMAPDKINVASFGNMTPHVHWHMIPRYTGRCAFPEPDVAVRKRASAPECWPRAAPCCRNCMQPSSNDPWRLNMKPIQPH